MGNYQYTAYNHAGNKVRGKIEAIDRREAYLKLKESGLNVTELNPHRESIFTREIEFLAPKVKSEDFMIFSRQFATMVRAGIAVADTIHILSMQTRNKRLKQALESVHEKLRAGNSLAKSFQEHVKIFPPLFINMVRAGETSGNLDGTFEKMALFFEKENRTKEKIKSALAYPITVSLLAFFVTLFLMWKVVPQFISTFASMHLQLPLLTRVVISFSHVISQFWFLFLMLPILLFLAVRGMYSTEKGRYWLDLLKLKIPIYGRLQQFTAMARLSRTFSSLYAASVPILNSLDLVSQVVGNAVVTKSLNEAKENLLKGQSLSEPLSNHWVFPPMMIHMLKVGERTGAIDLLLDKVADFYEEEVEQMAERLKSFLEPLMIVVVAAIVGIIVLAILLPTFTIYQNFK